MQKRRKEEKSPEEYELAAEIYFRSREGEVRTDAAGEVMVDKNGKPILTGAKPPTMTGLAIAFGFPSREAFLSFRGSREVIRVFDKSKSRIEEYLESCLFDKDTRDGAKFCLVNHFSHWQEKKQEADVEKAGGSVMIPLEEKQRLLKEISIEFGEKESRVRDQDKEEHDREE